MTPNTIELLASSKFLARLDEQSLTAIAALARPRTFAADEYVFEEGDVPNALFIVVAGEILITTADEVGKEVVLNRALSGAILGEIGLLDGRMRTASARTSGPCSVLRIPRTEFLSLMDRQPAIARQLIAALCSRVRHISKRVRDDQFLPLRARLARHILDLARTKGERVDGGILVPSVSQAELARGVGAARQTVNKHLQAFQREGILSLRRARLTLLDRRALLLAADPGLE